MLEEGGWGGGMSGGPVQADEHGEYEGILPITRKALRLGRTSMI